MIVNEFFLPVLKKKMELFDIDFNKEISLLENKKERIKQAYINNSFTLEEYDEEINKLTSQINELKRKQIEQVQTDELDLSIEDILVFRDIEFINKIKFPLLYDAFIDSWEDLTKEDKFKLVMRYIDDIELEMKNGKLAVKQINFRSTFYNDFNELYAKGFIDKKRPLTYDFNGACVDTSVRYSEYLPIKQVLQHLYRLNEYYEVNFYKGTYYKETEKLDIGPLQKNEVPIRIFPLQENNNGNENWVSMGMFATKNYPNDIKVNIRDVFETIPDNVNEEDF